MSTENEDQDKILLRLASHITAKLDELCLDYDMDRTHMLRRLITDGWEKLIEKKSKDRLIQEGMRIANEMVSRRESARAEPSQFGKPTHGVSGKERLHDQSHAGSHKESKYRKHGHK